MSKLKRNLKQIEKRVEQKSLRTSMVETFRVRQIVLCMQNISKFGSAPLLLCVAFIAMCVEKFWDSNASRQSVFHSIHPCHTFAPAVLSCGTRQLQHSPKNTDFREHDNSVIFYFKIVWQKNYLENSCTTHSASMTYMTRHRPVDRPKITPTLIYDTSQKTLNYIFTLQFDMSEKALNYIFHSPSESLRWL